MLATKIKAFVADTPIIFRFTGSIPEYGIKFFRFTGSIPEYGIKILSDFKFFIYLVLCPNLHHLGPPLKPGKASDFGGRCGWGGEGKQRRRGWQGKGHHRLCRRALGPTAHTNEHGQAPIKELPQPM